MSLPFLENSLPHRRAILYLDMATMHAFACRENPAAVLWHTVLHSTCIAVVVVSLSPIIDLIDLWGWLFLPAKKNVGSATDL